jgi:N-acetylmuramoyl-L-alanine amidase
MTRRSIVAFLIAVIWLSIPCSQALSAMDIFNIRRWTGPDHTRIVIDTSEKARYMTTEKDRKLFIDLLNTSFPNTIPHQYVLNKPAVEKILLYPLADEKVRIEIWLSENVKTKVFTLGKILNKPHRVVIDVLLPEIEKRESEERKQVKIQEKRKIIVIDPGHGGEDPGAIGRRGTKEKYIVLKIAKQLRNVLRRKGYQAYLTREGDYYVSFKKRLEIAREYGADLLVSIHTDAHRCRGARGASVYCFSSRGASSEAARILARNENLSDIIAGVANGNNNGESDPITLNMLQTETINQSKSFGGVVLQDLKKVNRVKYSEVQEAPFRVLKLPDIPSVLIEVAYISNPREELLLRQSSFRKDIVWSLASSIGELLPLPPSVVAEADNASYLSSQSDSHASREKEQIYFVKRGDYLSQIAEKYDTTVETMVEYNNLKRKNRIYRGQRLKIPPSSWKAESLSIPTETYGVKRGDTVGKIAYRCDTTIGTLLRLNDMSMKDRIYVGQELRVPVTIDDSENSDEKESKPSMHIVKRGEILDRIASHYNTTAPALMKLNNIKNKNRIYFGQKLKVSSASEQSENQTSQNNETSAETVSSSDHPLYIVKRGDTLGKIARKCNTTIGTLLKLNNLQLENGIYVRQKLMLPVKDDQLGSSIENISDATPQIAETIDSTGQSMQKEDVTRRTEPDQGTVRVASESDNKKDSIIEATQCTTYIVRKGDNLDSIAQKYNTTPETLMEVNEIKSKNIIYVNQKVTIPTAIANSADDHEGKSQPFIHIVKRGDTLENIALKYDITVAELMTFNNIKKKDRIYVKQKLKVPSSPEEKSYVMYVVKRGDFLKEIAGRHHTTVIALRKLNNLKDKNHIYAGQRLKIPSDGIR